MASTLVYLGLGIAVLCVFVAGRVAAGGYRDLAGDERRRLQEGTAGARGAINLILILGAAAYLGSLWLIPAHLVAAVVSVMGFFVLGTGLGGWLLHRRLVALGAPRRVRIRELVAMAISLVGMLFFLAVSLQVTLAAPAPPG